MTAWEVESLTFGLGLDRHSGPMVVDPATMRDLRNVHLRDGGFEVRGGMLPALSLGNGVVLAIEPVRSQAVAAVITYDPTTGQVNLYACSVDLGTATLVNTVFTLGAGASFPRVICADSNGKLLICHDEPDFAQRKKTMIYDAAAATVTAFQADLDGSGVVADTYFRWVRRYLNYIVFGGYGSERVAPTDDRNRPEIVRTTMPGELGMVPEHYFIAGQRGEPVVIGHPAGNVFLAFKESETYEIFGYDHATFGIRPADPHFGIAGARLGITIGGTCYFWSLEGPRRTRGGLSEDLAIYFDLKGPKPSTLALDNAVAGGFVMYVPERREVVWQFERFAYVFHIPSGRLSFNETGVSLNCAGILYPGTGTVATTLGPDFYGDITSVVLTGVTDRQATVTWNNLLFAGGPAAPTAADKAEVWARPLSGGVGQTWQLLADNIALAGPNDSATVTLPWYGSYHEVAVRIKRNGNYNSQYSSGSPTDWPGVAKDSSILTQLTYAPVLSNPVWSRTGATAERVQWSFTHDGDKQKNVTIEIEKSPDGIGSWVASGSGPYSGSNSPFDYNIVAGEGETDIWLRARIKTPDRTGAWSAAMATYCGPAFPLGLNIDNYLDGIYQVTWTPGISQGLTEIHTGINGGAMTLNKTVSYAASPSLVDVSCPATTVEAKIRHRVDSFNVSDYSKFTGTDQVAADCDTLPGYVPVTRNALVGTFNTTGTGIVSWGFQLQEGDLSEADFTLRRVVVKVLGVEKAIYAEMLHGRYPDGSVRSILIQFEHNTLASPEDATVEIGGGSRNLADRLKAPVTQAQLLSGRYIIPKDVAHTSACRATLLPILPAANELAAHSGLLQGQFANRAALWVASGHTLGTYQATYESALALIARWQANGSTNATHRGYLWQGVKDVYYQAIGYLLPPFGAGLWSPEPNPDGWTVTGTGTLPAEWNSQNQVSLYAAYWATGAIAFWNLAQVRASWATALNSSEAETATLGDSHAISAIYLPRFNVRHFVAMILSACADTKSFSGSFGTGRSLGGGNAAIELPWHLNAWNTHRFAKGDYRDNFRGADDNTTDGPANGAPANGDFPNFQGWLVSWALMMYCLNVKNDATVRGWIKTNVDILLQNVVALVGGNPQFAAGATHGYDYWADAVAGGAVGPDPWTFPMAADVLAFVYADTANVTYKTWMERALNAANVEGDGASGGSLGGTGNLTWGNATSNWSLFGKLFGQSFGYACAAPFLAVNGLPAGLPTAIRAPTQVP